MWVPGRSSSFPLPPLPHTWYDLISEQPVCGGHDALAGGLVLTTSEASACLAYWTGSQSGSLWVEDVVFRIKTWYEPTSEHLESFIITISMLNESRRSPHHQNHDLYCIAFFSFTCFECTARFTLCNLNRQDSFTFPPTCCSLRVEGQHHYMLSHRERKRPAAAAAEARQLFIAKSS